MAGGDFVKRLKPHLAQQILSYVDFRSKVGLEAVSRHWRDALYDNYKDNMQHLWLYTIFRRDSAPNHRQFRVRFSYHGPIFWERQVVYVYMCNCHFEQHERGYKALCRKIGYQVERICIVDSPVNYPFLTDEFYKFILLAMPNLEWIYLREIDLEPISWSLTHTVAAHATLKKIIVHWCRNYDALQNFEVLRKKLLVCNEQIRGLQIIDDIGKQLEDMRLQDAKDDAVAAASLTPAMQRSRRQSVRKSLPDLSDAKIDNDNGE